MTRHVLFARSELVECVPRRVEVDGRPLCVVLLEGRVHVIDDTCSHADASLSEGEVDVDDRTVECPLHGSPFRLDDGVPVSLPATRPVAVHQVVGSEQDEVVVEIDAP